MNDSGRFFAGAFTVVVVLQAAVRLWLGARQVRALERHRNHVPGPFAGRITLQEQQKGADYSAARTRLGRWHAAQDALSVLALTVGGGIAALAHLLEALALPQLLDGVLLILATLGLLQLAALPLDYWRTFVLEQRFGFNRSTPISFGIDLIKGWAVTLAIGTPLLFAALWIMERAGPTWWLWAFGLWLLAMLVLTWAVPLFIAPVFNRFVPLADPVLLGRVQSLMTRCGFSADGGVFVMDGSRRSAHGNAYFTGFGRAKRIVFFDTLLERMTADELEAILTHELGHFRLHHLQQRLAVAALTAALGLATLAWCARQNFLYAAFGITLPSSAAALLLFLMIAPVISFFFTPLQAWWSRWHERQADQFAAANSSAQDLSAALVKLYRDNADGLTPDPLYSRFYYSHPTALERIGWLDARASARDPAAANLAGT